MEHSLIDRTEALQTRLSVWPSAELDEISFHDAVGFMRYVGKEIERLRWLADHGERYFGTLWRQATAVDIDAVMQRVSASREQEQT